MVCTAAGTWRRNCKRRASSPELEVLSARHDRRQGAGRDARERATRWLQDFIAHAAKLGYSQYFFQDSVEIIDDHVSFEKVGVPWVDVVDAQFGRMGSGFDAMGEFHHANTDTVDKISQTSLDIVGRTILLTVELLDK